MFSSARLHLFAMLQLLASEHHNGLKPPPRLSLATRLRQPATHDIARNLATLRRVDGP